MTSKVSHLQEHYGPFLQSLPYKSYKYDIYPKVKHLRGATRLLTYFEDLSLLGIKDASESYEDWFEREWENLILLDGCRHDVYEEVNGRTDSTISAASCSPGYVEKTYSEGDFSDIVYISANPHFHNSIFSELTNRDLDDVFHTVYQTYLSEWNEKHGTVMPEKIVRDALNAEKMFPDKRKVIHFMQPHYPFIESDWDLDIEGFERHPEKYKKSGYVWELAEKGILNREEVWEAYRNNLEYVMPHVDKLAKDLSGRTVVSADHGNLVGENGRYDHPCDRESQVLRKVPWSVIND